MNTSHSDYPFDLGTHCPAFVVTNDEAAAWFATGLSWLYGFNHEEAIGCFRHAARADDGFALAWWGIAISSGPFMNKPWEWLTMPEKGTRLRPDMAPSPSRCHVRPTPRRRRAP